MDSKETARYTVRSNEQFTATLVETYPAANTVSQAIIMAAQEGLMHRKALENDFETYVCRLVREEVQSELEARDEVD